MMIGSSGDPNPPDEHDPALDDHADHSLEDDHAPALDALEERLTELSPPVPPPDELEEDVSLEDELSGMTTLDVLDDEVKKLELLELEDADASAELEASALAQSAMWRATTFSLPAWSL